MCVSVQQLIPSYGCAYTSLLGHIWARGRTIGAIPNPYGGPLATGLLIARQEAYARELGVIVIGVNHSTPYNLWVVYSAI